MALQINDLRSGITIAIGSDVFMIISVDHVKPGKGSAFARTKLKNLRLGTVIDRTYKSSEKIQDAFIEEKKIQYSYKTGHFYHFLNQETFEDLVLEENHLGDTIKFLQDNIIVSAYFYNNELLNISLPTFIVAKITNTEPGFKGDTAKSSGKPATIETGATIQVPLFVNVGDKVKVDTRTGEYMGRV
ncbi:elongation factor P [Candidatus Omnitrophota bacterium]